MLPELVITLWLLLAVVAPGARALFAGESARGVRSRGLGPLGRLGLLFPAQRASRRSVIAARAIHALPAETAAARYRSKLWCRRFRKRLEARFAQVCGILFPPRPATAHRALSFIRCVSQARPRWPRGRTLDGSSEVVVFNQTEFSTSAMRTCMPRLRHSSEWQVMESENGLWLRASVIVLA